MRKSDYLVNQQHCLVSFPPFLLEPVGVMSRGFNNTVFFFFLFKCYRDYLTGIY